MADTFARARAERRLAEFVLGRGQIKTHPDRAAELLGRVLVVDARPDYASNGIRYTAWGPMFEPVPEGHPAPIVMIRYRWVELFSTRELAAFEFAT